MGGQRSYNGRLESVVPFCGCSTGITDCHFHDLRNEATTRCFEKGLNPVEAPTITGHKETRVLIRFRFLRAVDLVERLG